MPSLGADMEAGKLVEWLKRPGEPVARGDIIAVVETQKGAIEVEVFEDGRLVRLLVEPGTTVPVGTPMAEIVGAAAPISVGAPEVAAPPPAPPTTVRPPPVIVPVPALAEAGLRPRVSPAARKLAAERGVDLTGLAGSGPAGALISADVAKAAPAPPPKAEKPRRGLDLGEMRKAIAAAMARSKREIPHYYLAHDIDVSEALAWLERTNAARPPEERLLPAVLFLKAVALALRRFPEFNGFYEAGGFRPGPGIHAGSAVAIRGGGLVAPAIRDTDGRSLDALMAALRDLVGRVRAGRLRSSELYEATVTVTSLGERGVGAVFGVIYPPQVAIIGFGRPAPRPWVVDAAIGIRQVVTASLAADHRVSDGHRGALLLAEIDRLLQEPDKL
jgi:pyruvate dehydrogenase E2 component (dihydrolipoamide acetyltransferase)